MHVREIAPGEPSALGELTVVAYAALEGREALGDYAGELRDVAARARDAVVLVAVDDGRLLGGVTYVPDPGNPFAEFDDPQAAGIRMLAVDPAAQGRGVGEALVRACLDRALRDQRARLVLHSTPAMLAAQRLYRRLGFVRRPDLDWRPSPGPPLLGFVLELAAQRGGARDAGPR